MKLLVVVRSQHRPNAFANGTLRFITRAGFDYRIYLKKIETEKYRLAMARAEDVHYLFVPEENIFWVRNVNNLPNYLTKTEGKYDLLLELPDNIKIIKGARGVDDQLLLFFRLVREISSKFEEDAELYELDAPKIHKDAFMVRLK